ncbi:MAG: hypothetical protein H0S85_17080 [Desulfovibrionaceae bacterium]|nr:hypothetical protein [Desulfovibrionaceae bacterium]
MEHLTATVRKQVSGDEARRREAIFEYLAVTLPDIAPGVGEAVAAMVPRIPDEVYEGWAAQFANRLLETVPREQVEELCDGTCENNAAIVLTYIMFMESERMERKVEEDIARYCQAAPDDSETGELVRAYLRSRITAARAAGGRGSTGA